MKQRNGVLGLDTAKQVLITFLILAVTGVAIILSLTSLQNAGSTIDTSSTTSSVVNETSAWLNATNYNLVGYNTSWSGITINALWNASTNGAGVYNLTLPLSQASVLSNGAINSSNSTSYKNVSVSYGYTFTYDNMRTDNIVGNVSGGVVTFFASTGTIFSILIVVVIILAISIIIWAVGRFGQQTEGAVNL